MPVLHHRDVSTLDHVLPKTLFPSLAVTPLNLVGSWKDCNKAKLAAAPSNTSYAVLHPYFEDISSQIGCRQRSSSRRSAPWYSACRLSHNGPTT